MSAISDEDYVEIKSKIKRWGERIDKASPILKERYNDCDKKHRDANEKDNLCGHCYQRLKYDTPRTDEIMAERAELPSYLRPMDAPVIMEKTREEIAWQKHEDWMDGLSKIADEFEF